MVNTRSKSKMFYFCIMALAVLVIVGVTFASVFFIERTAVINVYPVAFSTTIDMQTTLDDVSAGDEVISEVSFNKNTSDNFAYVRVGVYYYKVDDISTNDKIYLVALNATPIATDTGSNTYSWVKHTDGYYYLCTYNTTTPLKITSDATTYIFCEDVNFPNINYLYKDLSIPSDLKLKVNIEALYQNTATTTSVSTIATSFASTFGTMPNYGYIVNFDTDGGSSVKSQVFLTSDGVVTRPSNPTKTGCVFENWYTDSGFTSTYNFAGSVTGNITLYAKFLTKYNFDLNVVALSDFSNLCYYSVDKGVSWIEFHGNVSGQVGQIRFKLKNVDGNYCSLTCSELDLDIDASEGQVITDNYVLSEDITVYIGVTTSA